MKRIAYLLLAFALLLGSVMPVFATDGHVNYKGDAGKFIFTPGTRYSPTDLFPSFKDVMPGDSLTQKIVVKNDASHRVKVKIFMRALGAHEGSEEFLSQLRLRVELSANNTMAYMFDAAANETAQLSDWVCLGTLYSGGHVNLDVILDVPVELGNDFQNAIGYLDWEFMIEEYDIDPTDPEPPKTGDEMQPLLWGGLAFVSLLLLIVIPLTRRKKEED